MPSSLLCSFRASVHLSVHSLTHYLSLSLYFQHSRRTGLLLHRHCRRGHDLLCLSLCQANLLGPSSGPECFGPPSRTTSINWEWFTTRIWPHSIIHQVRRGHCTRVQARQQRGLVVAALLDAQTGGRLFYIYLGTMASCHSGTRTSRKDTERDPASRRMGLVTTSVVVGKELSASVGRE